MAKARTAPACGCPVAAFQKMISGKYKLRIVWDLKDGPRRYGEIRTGLLRGSVGSAEIAPRVLSRELKALTESGLIDHFRFPARVFRGDAPVADLTSIGQKRPRRMHFRRRTRRSWDGGQD
jgi:DNA-binding HxlR family transcriptional regulator